jgi:hypothetical protein
MSDDTAKRRNDSVVLVEPGQMAGLQKRLDSLNKKAVAFGLEPIRIVSADEVLYQRKTEYIGRDMDRQASYLVPAPAGAVVEAPVLLNRLEIEYPEIKLGHWRVVGKLEAIDGGNLTFSVSRDAADVGALVERAEHPIECEHCKTKRSRNDGYLLRDAESGAYKQVGSNCLEDFTGINPATALFLARMYEVVKLADDDLGDYAASGGWNALSTHAYLADVSMLIEHDRFVSASMARDIQGLRATYDLATEIGRSGRNIDRVLHNLGVQPGTYWSERERHLAKAKAVCDWVAAKPEESDFDRNVKLLLRGEAILIDRKRLAFAAAAVSRYNRSLLAEIEQRKPSEHIGAPGQKMAAALTVERVIQLANPFNDGPLDLVLLRDAEGNKLKWKTASCPREIYDGGVGRQMEATFKVKEHGDYKGTHQTSVTHLKVTRWLDLDNAAEPEADAPETGDAEGDSCLQPPEQAGSAPDDSPSP